MQINENLAGAASPNVATSDENLSINDIFQLTSLPSLGRLIMPVLPMTGPTAALFSVQKNSVGDIELLRREVTVNPSNSISSGLTQEVVEDLESQYGLHAQDLIGKMLRGSANDAENVDTLTFLTNNSALATPLTRSTPSNATTTFNEISQVVQDLVLKMNINGLKTYKSFCVLPYTIASSIMALGNSYKSDDDANELFIGKIGSTSYYVNPDVLASEAYVGLIDNENPSKSSGIFSPFASEIVESVNHTTGNHSYHIYNRYAITASPLSTVGNELFHRFTIV